MSALKNKQDEFFIPQSWDVQSRRLKKEFKQLTDEDLRYEPGKESELISRMENKLNVKHEEAIDILKTSQQVAMIKW